MNPIFSILIFVALVVALPGLSRGLKGFLLAIYNSACGVVLPVFVFVFSVFLIPDWKGAAQHGWLDCFHCGKLALSPLVLWAVTAFFAVEIYRVENRSRPWIVLGYFLGAIVGSVCFLFGLICRPLPNEPVSLFFLWMLVPAYVAVWYSLRAGLLMANARLKAKTYVGAFAGSLPLWVWSILWSQKIYNSLPDVAPSCFVVTAASRGHCRVVGPLFEIARRGGTRFANRQLLTFWQFEEAWLNHFPRIHRCFRRIYNCIGPAIARRLTTPWLADAAYLALKPLEIAAAFIARIEWILFNHEHAREVAGSVETKSTNSGGLL
jgi:hypothetical protein